MKIKNISVDKILSSQGNETIQIFMKGMDGREAEVGVPAGISAGKYEAKNVTADEAVEQVVSIEDELISREWTQENLDTYLKSKNLGANAQIAISLAFWKLDSILGESFKPQKFPKLLLLLFEGGKHGAGGITIQEFLIIEESIQAAKTDFAKLKQYLTSQSVDAVVGAEGAFSPFNFNNELVLETIKKAFPDKKIALDAAGSFRNEEVKFEEILDKYNIASIEDPYSDEDWEKWVNFKTKFGQKIMVTGDDLTVTNPGRLQMAIDKNAINAVVIKPNQNGTISGTLEAVNIARRNGLKIIVSHRGDETLDTWIADFALFINADYVKFGGMEQDERLAKYKRLIEFGMT